MPCRTQVAAEAVLMESEHHLRSLMESASGFVLFRFCHNPMDPFQPRRIFISPSIADIVDRTKVVDFQSFLTTVHPEDRESLVSAAHAMLDARRMDETIRTQGGSSGFWRWLRIIAVAVATPPETYFNGIILDITGEMETASALSAREKELKERTESLSEVNTALEVLLRKREADRLEVEEKMLANAKRLILPYLDKLKNSRLDERQRIYLNLIETNLNEIISPLTQQMSRHYMHFTPLEIQVANLVKEGQTTKDIAFILGSSDRTIEAVRYRIRRKLGLKKKCTNLRSALLSIDG
ncbi:LuxR C-terminal-related transcriptional regulator [Desulfosarcina cetonica]